ncbi:NFX1-type zinc finger-containing protein 1 [Octopus bimaculoides]|uniref:NFX1-type zinc finger-containing protein 1 n=1 Tax=Octopus bimaculoides TaxID=37653 RepID=UPI00071CBE84|nr:NFX1-type zinc finger-containing protein 1 [Octopus bimaculoides]|eukprot:XP_014781926.1 PREDICTED: NFX1-type zinc finger-containing protein 1-like [Octopus bimaculoides]
MEPLSPLSLSSCGSLYFGINLEKPSLCPNFLVFQCSKLLAGLTAEKDAEVRTRIFAKLEQNQDVTLQQVSEECERIVRLRHETEEIECKDYFQVKQIVRIVMKCFLKEHIKNQEINPCFVCGGIMDNYGKRSKRPDRKQSKNTNYNRSNQNSSGKDKAVQFHKSQQSNPIASDGKQHKTGKFKTQLNNFPHFRNDCQTSARSKVCFKHRICCLNLKLFQDLIEKDANSICLKLGSCEECFKYFLNKPIDLHTTTLFLKVLRQREENDIILLSLVRSNEHNSIGYLKIDNRVCVALSRAKKGLYVIGNFKLLATNSPLWAEILLSLEEKKILVDAMILKCQNHPETHAQVASFEDFCKAPEGGCLKPCEARLDCGHTCALMCHPYDKEHTDYICKKQCVKTLPVCNHPCLRSCSERCMPCIMNVTKVIPNCSHHQEMFCSKDPVTFICQEPCPLEFPCGHKCLNKCGENCLSECHQIVENTCPYGHTSNIECYQKEKCFAICKELLDCGHFCKGYCFECHGIHIHKPCMEGCDRILICGHKCQNKDCSSCTPCERPCENRCLHNKCKKKCGEPCKQCNEPCQWECMHYKCSKLCHEPCDRPACNAPCEKLLDCSHQCVGVCGEQCPELCSICNEDELKEIFFGNEDENGARFVQLEDCKHIFEVTGLDNWMEVDLNNSEIQLKLCPKCKTPIRRNHRYGNLINKTLQDIEKVKEKLNADPIEVFTLKSYINSNPNNIRHLRKLEKHFHIGSIISKEHFISMKTKAQYLEVLSKLSTINIQYLVEWFVDHKARFTAQELKEASLEVQHLQVLENIENLKTDTQGMSDISSLLKEASTYLEGFYSEEKQSKIETILNKIETLKPSLKISEKERFEIVQALQLPKGHWFKCKNGHIYAIGDCGGAVVTSTCPECKCEIGGTSHQLLASNTLANEMDGAEYAAWSDAANLNLIQ